MLSMNIDSILAMNIVAIIVIMKYAMHLSVINVNNNTINCRYFYFYIII